MAINTNLLGETDTEQLLAGRNRGVRIGKLGTGQRPRVGEEISPIVQPSEAPLRTGRGVRIGTLGTGEPLQLFEINKEEKPVSRLISVPVNAVADYIFPALGGIFVGAKSGRPIVGGAIGAGLGIAAGDILQIATGVPDAPELFPKKAKEFFLGNNVISNAAREVAFSATLGFGFRVIGGTLRNAAKKKVAEELAKKIKPELKQVVEAGLKVKPVKAPIDQKNVDNFLVKVGKFWSKTLQNLDDEATERFIKKQGEIGKMNHKIPEPTTKFVMETGPTIVFNTKHFIKGVGSVTADTAKKIERVFDTAMDEARQNFTKIVLPLLKKVRKKLPVDVLDGIRNAFLTKVLGEAGVFKVAKGSTNKKLLLEPIPSDFKSHRNLTEDLLVDVERELKKGTAVSLHLAKDRMNRFLKIPKILKSPEISQGGFSFNTAIFEALKDIPEYRVHGLRYREIFESIDENKSLLKKHNVPATMRKALGDDGQPLMDTLIRIGELSSTGKQAINQGLIESAANKYRGIAGVNPTRIPFTGIPIPGTTISPKQTAKRLASESSFMSSAKQLFLKAGPPVLASGLISAIDKIDRIIAGEQE